MSKPTVKELLDEKGKTPEEFAKKLDFNNNFTTNLIKGTFHRLDVQTAIKIADYFGKEVEDILWKET